MSQHAKTISRQEPVLKLLLGWDGPDNSFFASVLDCDDQLVVEIGACLKFDDDGKPYRDEVNELHELASRLEGELARAGITGIVAERADMFLEDTWDKLEADKVARGNTRTPLQRRMMTRLEDALELEPDNREIEFPRLSPILGHRPRPDGV
jgi:hypothetical protein